MSSPSTIALFAVRSYTFLLSTRLFGFVSSVLHFHIGNTRYTRFLQTDLTLSLLITLKTEKESLIKYCIK